MKFKKLKNHLLMVVGLLVAGVSSAETTPVMFSLFAPVQVPYRSYDVKGFRLSLLYGECRDFTGLDIGVVQRSTGDFTGLSIGGANIVGGQFYGLQVGIVNVETYSAAEWSRRSAGVQFGLVNHAEDFCGLQNGVINAGVGTITGLQDGFVNFAENLQGAQCGNWLILGVNVASSVRGCQLGLINYANRMESGLQIGIVNIIANNGWLPVLPLVNGGF